MPRRRDAFTVRRHRRRNRRGKVVESVCYYVHFHDHLGTERVLKARPEKDASTYMARHLAAAVSHKAAGQPLSADLRAFIENQPTAVRKKLHKWGLLDAGTSAGFAPLMDFSKKQPARSNRKTFKITGGHLADWRASMQASERAPAHVKETVQRAARLIDACGFAYPGDIDAEKVRNVLGGMRRKLSARTVNSHLGSLKSLCSWMVKAGRITRNPVRHVAPLPEIEKRKRRRALTAKEAGELLAAAAKGEKHHGLTGPERALVYRLALTTGARANEIRTLTRGDFHLNAAQPYVTIRAENAKNRKTANLPLRPEVAAELVEYFAARPAMPAARAFPGGWGKAWEMLKADLKSAEIPYHTREGDADFHSLRHTFGTMLARSGVLPQHAQKLMRHSSVDLTMNLYTHLRLEDSGQAVARLPEIKPPAESAIRTGTLDTPEASNAVRTANYTANVARNGRNAAILRDSQAADSAHKKPATVDAASSCGCGVSGVSEEIRTPDLQIHNLTPDSASDGAGEASGKHDAECTAKRTGNVSAIEHDLAELTGAWPDLPADIRAQVLALVRGAAR